MKGDDFIDFDPGDFDTKRSINDLIREYQRTMQDATGLPPEMLFGGGRAQGKTYTGADFGRGAGRTCLTFTYGQRLFSIFFDAGDAITPAAVRAKLIELRDRPAREKLKIEAALARARIERELAATGHHVFEGVVLGRSFEQETA